MSGESEPLLQVRDLTIDLASGRNIISEVSFQIEPGAIVGLFGESGCGRTTLALALLNLLPAPRYRVRGSVRLNNQELLSLADRQLERLRGADIIILRHAGETA